MGIESDNNGVIFPPINPKKGDPMHRRYSLCIRAATAAEAISEVKARGFRIEAAVDIQDTDTCVVTIRHAEEERVLVEKTLDRWLVEPRQGVGTLVSWTEMGFT